MATKPTQPVPEASPTTIGGEDYKDFLDDLDRDKVAWNPNPGAKVVGRIVAILTATSEYGSYPLITLDPGPNGPLVDVHAFHTWLKSDVMRLGLREGDTFGVKYVGRAGERNMATYRTQVKRTGSGPVYSPGTAVAEPTDKQEQMFEEPF